MSELFFPNDIAAILSGCVIRVENLKKGPCKFLQGPKVFRKCYYLLLKAHDSRLKVYLTTCFACFSGSSPFFRAFIRNE